MRTVLPKDAILVPKHAKRVFKGIIYDTYHWDQELYDGTVETFEMLKRPDTVKVIPVIDDKIVILEQEQPNIGKFYDIPGGIHDHEDETELQAVKRELLEESGLAFKSWRLLSVQQPHNKIEQFVYTFLATDLESETEPTPDPGEKISVKNMSFIEVQHLLASKNGRYIPEEIGNSNSIEELLAIPEFKVPS